MSASKYVTFQRGRREENWAEYFALDPDGQNLFQCITSVIKSSDWASTAGAARQIASIFRTSGLAYRSSPESIAETNESEGTGMMSKVTQQLQLMSCIATVFNLQLELD